MSDYSDEDFTRMEITVCLACADGDCITCYGDRCECRCLGNQVGEEPSELNAQHAITVRPTR